MTLSEVKNGHWARIARFLPQQLDSATLNKLVAMGLAPGSRVQLVRRAPLGRSIQLKLQGSALCLNHNLAQLIEVENA